MVKKIKRLKSSKSNSEKVAEILLKIKAVTLSPKEPYKFASGILSPVYVDCRLLMSYPKERKIIRDLYVKSIKRAGDFDVIAGTSTAGIPHAAYISEKMNKPMVYVRVKNKDHGKKNQIEGKLGKKQKAAIIEDLISTGESSIDTAKSIKDFGAKADHIFAIITYGMKVSTKNFKENKLRLSHLTTFEEIVKVAEKLKMVTEVEKELILKWTEDPVDWGKKNGFE